MIAAQWGRIRQEWRDNARLRWGGLIVVAILGAQAVWSVADARREIAREYVRDAGLLARLEAAGQDTAWPRRAKEAENARRALFASVPEARSEGAAKADLQAWLAQLAKDATLTQPLVRVETVTEVPGYPELQQVAARLEGTVPTPLDVAPVMRGLAAGLPWIQADQVEVGENAPVRVVMIVRAFYRRPAGAAAAVSRDEAGSESAR